MRRRNKAPLRVSNFQTLCSSLGHGIGQFNLPVPAGMPVSTRLSSFSG